MLFLSLHDNHIRTTFPWRPSCWKSFTRRRRPRKVGYSAGCTASVVSASGRARARGLTSRSAPYSRPSHCLVETDFQMSRLAEVNDKASSKFCFMCLCCKEEFEKQSGSEGFTGKVFRDQRILLGTTFDLLASAVNRSPSALEALGGEKAQRVLELSRASSRDQVQ